MFWCHLSSNTIIITISTLFTQNSLRHEADWREICWPNRSSQVEKAFFFSCPHGLSLSTTLRRDVALFSPTFVQVKSVYCCVKHFSTLQGVMSIGDFWATNNLFTVISCLFLYRRNARHLGEDEDPLTQCVRQGGEELIDCKDSYNHCGVTFSRLLLWHMSFNNNLATDNSIQISLYVVHIFFYWLLL